MSTGTSTDLTTSLACDELTAGQVSRLCSVLHQVAQVVDAEPGSIREQVAAAILRDEWQAMLELLPRRK